MKVFLDHGEAYQNLGDEAMLQSAIDKFRFYYPQCKIIVPSTSPDLLPTRILDDVEIVPSLLPFFSRLNRLYKLASKQYISDKLPDATKLVDYILNSNRDANISIVKSQYRLTEAIQSSDIFYGVGGAYFNDFYPLGIGYKRWMYHQINSNTVSTLSAQGFGPLETRWARKATKEAINNLDLVTFRDSSYSKETIGRLCPDVEQKIVGDEAFGLQIAKSTKIDEYLRSAGLEPESEFVAFHYRATDYTQDTAHLVDKLARIIDSLTDNLDLPIVFIPMSYGKHSGHDRKYGKRIKQNVNSEDFYIGPESNKSQIIKGVVGRSFLALGLSYHFHVFALSQAIPALVLYSGEYYRLKSEGLFGHYSLTECVMDIEKKSVSDITLACSNTISDEIRKHIKKENERFEDEYTWTVERTLEKCQNKGNN